MRTIVHIGSTKTGSSALQRFLHVNRRVLRDQGVLYPETGIKAQAHHLLFAPLHQTAIGLHRAELGDVDAARTRLGQALASEIERHRPRVLVLSSEYLWTQDEPARVAEFLQSAGVGTFEVVCYVREITTWLRSQYNQSIKAGNGVPFGTWLRRVCKRRHGGAFYATLLSAWQTLPTVQRVHARIYSPEALTDGLFVDFLRYLDLAPAGFDLEVAGQVNPSPDHGTLELLSTLNAMTLDSEIKDAVRDRLFEGSRRRAVFEELPGVSRQQKSIVERQLTQEVAGVAPFLDDPDEARLLLQPKLRADDEWFEDVKSRSLSIIADLVRAPGTAASDEAKT